MALATAMSSCPKTSPRIGDNSLLLLNNPLRRADRLEKREDDANGVVAAAVAASAAGLAGQLAAAAAAATELAGLATTDAVGVRALLTVAGPGRPLPQSRRRKRADRKQLTAAITAAMKSTMTMDLKSESPKGGAATSLSGSAVASSSATGTSSGMGPATAVTPGHGHGHGAIGDGAVSGGSSTGAGAGAGAGGVVTSAAGGGGLQRDCAGCKKRISERYMLKALDLFWHEDCLKCACCDCRLGEVGSTLFTKANLMLCKRDYLRLFGTTGYCSACSKMIPAFEMVMRARGNVYHLECFACQQCNHRFCVGDRFYLCENKILCEYDYEERMVFANMPYNYNSIAHIKRQTHNLNPAVLNDNDGSSGYGSPDSLTFDGK